MTTIVFVTYEQAKKLKELGFKDLCLFNYDLNGNRVPNSLVSDGVEGVTTVDLLTSFNSEQTERIDCPTLSQVQTWLKKEKEIYLMCEIQLGCEIHNAKFEWIVYNRKGYIMCNLSSGFIYDTSEEALSAGITECIKFLEK